MTLEIAPCTAADLAELLLDASRHAHRDHLTRFAQQQAGEAIYLLARRDGVLAGRATVLAESKYAAVRAARPGTAEINALDATPQGLGTGTALIRHAEQVALAAGHPAIGMAVESGGAAHRLYARLGYQHWDGGEVVDEWTELLADGGEHQHADPGDYLIKELR